MRPMRPSASTGTSSAQALGQSCGQADLAIRCTSCCMRSSCSAAGPVADHRPSLLPAGFVDGALQVLEPILAPEALALEEIERGAEHPAPDGFLSISAVLRLDIIGGCIPDERPAVKAGIGGNCSHRFRIG